MIKQIVILNMLLTWKLLQGYNLSPIANYKIMEPQINVYMARVESSYFGFAVTLRENSIMIGAPRAQSTLESQRKVNQTGAVYKCNIHTSDCSPFNFDPQGNTESDKYGSNYAALKKDHQYLGMTMDGLASDSSRFVACAPNIITDTLAEHYLYNGVCYVSDNTKGNKPVNNYEVETLRNRDLQITNNNSYYYMYGQLGFSVHVTENDEEILFGAPGTSMWKGSVFAYRQVEDELLTSIQKRSIPAQNKKRPNRQINYQNVVVSANPSMWNLENDTYFGYAVCSANFYPKEEYKLLYVASAPRANDLKGKVIIFQYEPAGSGNLEQSIKKYYDFEGHEMGENFGYALITDDFNGDGLVDLAISAPFNTNHKYDDGRVYIYLNMWKDSSHIQSGLQFHEQVNPIMAADYDSDAFHAQFGMSLAKIGDINQDGYADIAVGAPYENEIGAVYIFLGSKNGIIPQYSQKLTPPPTTTIPQTFSSMQLFGMGLSRGVDFDQNGFNDLAIGAPNIDTVYVYKSYPSIMVESTIASLTPEVDVNVTTAKIKVCMKYSTIKELPFTVGTQFTIKLDPIKKRARFSDGLLDKNITVDLTPTEQCFTVDIQLKSNLNEIFVPISLELHHALMKDFKSFEAYCTDCVALNPLKDHFVKGYITFNTGCRNVRCISNLKLYSNSTDVKENSYLLGSSKFLTIDYTVQNTGEVAYMTEITIELPQSATFYFKPVQCKHLSKLVMACNLGYGRPFISNEEYQVTVQIDTTGVGPGDLVIKANVTSSGDESDDSDNRVETTIKCIEFSDIEVTGISSVPEISVRDVGLISYNVTQRYDIRNFGPSKIREMEFIVEIPIGFVTRQSTIPNHLIESGDIKISGQYGNLALEPKWSHSIASPTDHSVVSHVLATEIPQNYSTRRIVRHINSTQMTNRNENANLVKLTPTQHKISNLPHNRLIYFNCTDQAAELNHLCIKAFIQINDFEAVPDKIATIQVQYSIDLEKIDRLYTDTNDMFVLALSSNVKKANDAVGATIIVTTLDPFIVITKYEKKLTPLWLIILSILIGLFILVLITYTFHKIGFFKRTKKEEMDQLVKEDKSKSNVEYVNDEMESDDL